MGFTGMILDGEHFKFASQASLQLIHQDPQSHVIDKSI